uniref:hypothetical protein n=1 Tax=uncultured Propionibacterium sp. TaxID=218066 RepID=UPI00292EB35A
MSAHQSRNWFFEMPWHVQAPELTSTALSLDRVVLLGSATGQVTLTVLDTPAERLLHAGVMVAQRAVGEVGEWFVWAPDWGPWLPGEQSGPIASDTDSEMPDEVDDLIAPFRRGARLEPVVSCTRVRARYGILDGSGEVLAVLTDDRVTMRRGGIATGRFRESTVDVARLSPQQRAFVAERMAQVGAVRVDGFRDLFARVSEVAPGAVPTGRNPADGTTAGLLSWLLARRFHSILAADLALRSGDTADPGVLADSLREFRDELDVLRDIVDEPWRADQLGRLDVLGAVDPDGITSLPEYDALLDAIELAVRIPRVGGDTDGRAAEDFGSRLETEIRGLRAGADFAVEHPDDDATWAQALASAERALGLVRVARPAIRKAKRTARLLARIVSALAEARGPEFEQSGLAALTPEQAYRLGRADERAGARASAA